MTEFPPNVVEMINARLGGYDEGMGLRFISARPDEFIAELDVAEHHLQPYGLVHGGVLSGMIETLCSVGAALNVYTEGKNTVGLENSTSFLRAVRSGTLRGTARPLFRGRRSHVWHAEVRDDRDRQVACGRVRMLVLDPGSAADGQVVGFQEE